MVMASAHLARLQAKLSNQWISSKLAQAGNWMAMYCARMPVSSSAARTRAAKQYFGALLITLGILLSAYVGGTYAWMYHEQKALLHKWQVSNASAGDSMAPAEANALTRILIPKIKLDAVITEGTSHRALTLGPGHLQDSATPGDVGNSVIAAHRDTFFRHIYELNAGDDIYVERHGKQFHYVVTGKRIVQPTDVSVLDGSSEARLTLITCYPVYFIGPAPERLVIVAELAKQV
jgi:LPXTG-site transpeptidase (sortase) family protein